MFFCSFVVVFFKAGLNGGFHFSVRMRKKNINKAPNVTGTALNLTPVKKNMAWKRVLLEITSLEKASTRLLARDKIVYKSCMLHREVRAAGRGLKITSFTLECRINVFVLVIPLCGFT